jgi:quercetin dioxygenase-like cupin family protein
LTAPAKVFDRLRAPAFGDAKRADKEIHMRRKLTWVVLFTAVIMVTALYHAKKVMATPSEGFVSTTLALGQFGEIDVLNHLVLPGNTGKIWLSLQKTEGRSDVYVQSNVWQPGGTTGWHTHPGHSLIVVTAGTLTAYEGHDPNCKPHVYTVGTGFVDPGGNHVHIIRNEGAVEASTIAVQTIPADATRRVDAPDPGNCHF